MQRTDASDAVLVRQALSAWFDGVQPNIKPLGEGHINSTWRVRTASGDFVLQRISREVFPEPIHIGRNMTALFDVCARDQDFNYQLPQPLPALNGETLVRLGEAATDTSYWRLSRFFADTRTLQSLDNIEQALAAGEAFGRFQRMAQALEPASLIEVISGFHQLAGYWQNLQRSVELHDHLQPAEASLFAQLKQQLPTFVAGNEQQASAASEPVVDVIHGDCKVNNLLYAQDTDKVVAVLDLDTLMVGPWWLDFGDLVRSAAYSRDGIFRPNHYAAVAQGFFSGRGKLPEPEIELALRAPAYVGFMLSLRFLDDHLRGDRYFRVIKSGDNLLRAQDQFEQMLQLEVDTSQTFMRDVLRQLAL